MNNKHRRVAKLRKQELNAIFIRNAFCAEGEAE